MTLKEISTEVIRRVTKADRFQSKYGNGNRQKTGLGDIGAAHCLKIGFLSESSNVWLMLRLVASAAVLVVAITLTPVCLCLYLLCYLRAIVTDLVARTKSMRLLTANDALTGQDPVTCNAVISTLTFLDGEVRPEDICDVMKRRVIHARDEESGRLRFPVFSRHVSTFGDYLVWCDDTDIDLDDHVVVYDDGGTPPETEEQLRDVVTNIYNTPMNLDRSGWQIVVVPLSRQFKSLDSEGSNLSGARPVTCLLWRFHHSIGDGVSLTRLVMEHIAENVDDLKKALPATMTKPTAKRIPWYLRIAKKFVKGIHALLLSILLMSREFTSAKINLLHGPRLTGKKIVDWSRPIDLQMVKDIKNAMNTTVNDVVLSCLSGALRRYFLKHKVEVPAYVFTAIPVTLQVADEKFTVKNNFSFLLMKLPTLVEDACDRLKQVKHIMDGMKNSPQVLINFWFIRCVFNVIPNTITNWFMEKSKNVTLAASNVPGPIIPVKVCGRTMTKVIPFLPHKGRMGLAVSIFSYEGKIHLGITADTALMKKNDVQWLMDGFHEEMQELRRAVT